MASLLEVCGLTVELPTAAGWVRPVNDLSLRIGAGESLGLVGESGSGKTMMALTLMGLLPPGARVGGQATLVTKGVNGAKEKNDETGEKMRAGTSLIGLNEREWREVRGRQIAMIFQEPMTALNPVMRV